MLHIRTSGITIDNFHNDHVYKCVNFWYDKKKGRKTKTKENPRMQRNPSEAEKSPKYDICKLSVQIDVLLCCQMSLLCLFITIERCVTTLKNNLKCRILQSISYFISTWLTSEFLSFVVTAFDIFTGEKIFAYLHHCL